MAVVTPPGHSQSVWAPRLSTAAKTSLDELLILTGARRGSVLFVAGAHPDDETLGLGRLMSMWVRLVGPVSVVIASAGEACLDHLGRRPGGLAVRRLDEWNLAMDDLGVGERSCLGMSDGQVAEQEDALAAGLNDALGHGGASGSVVIAAPWRHDPHPDHRGCGRAAARVADERGMSSIEFPVWATYWGDPCGTESVSAKIIEVEHDRVAGDAHRLACQRFVSQLAPLARDLSPVVPAEMLAHHDKQLIFLPAVDRSTS